VERSASKELHFRIFGEDTGAMTTQKEGMTKQRIQTVTLDPDVWSRGPASYALLHNDHSTRQQCCIGVACTALGVPDDQIQNLTYPDYVSENVLPDVIARLTDAFRESRTVYQLNDSGEFTTDAERVKAINATLKQHQIELRFRLKKARRAKAAKARTKG
jgi:hypothetical protein